ncbi:MAG: flagellin [FCB group bacterium]|nr:flagellin [FCB group bacterium]
MGLRITANVVALDARRKLSRSTEELNSSLDRLSSGLRLNRTGEDTTGLATPGAFRSKVRGSQIAQRNAQDGVSMMQTAEGSLSETTGILRRVRELAVEASTDSQSEGNRAALDSEVQQLLAQVDDLANETQFNGISVLSVAQTVTLQAGAHSGHTLEVALEGATSEDLGLSGMSIASTEGALSAISTVDAALERVSVMRGDLGGQRNRLEATIGGLAILEENSAASESAIRDADIAKETIQFTRNQMLVSAGNSIVAQANVVPQSALSLLG